MLPYKVNNTELRPLVLSRLRLNHNQTINNQNKCTEFMKSVQMLVKEQSGKLRKMFMHANNMEATSTKYHLMLISI